MISFAILFWSLTSNDLTYPFVFFM
jgi:hypothetical protein